MKAFLLAAGLGTRLRPLTDTLPKCLVDICGRPLLSWWTELLEKHGISEVLLNLHHHPEMVRAFINSYKGPVKFHLVEEPHLLGSAGTIKNNVWFINDASEFFILYADNLTSCDLSGMLQFHKKARHSFTMALIRAERPEQCGIAEVNDADEIIEFIEKPKAPKSNLANAGIYLANSELLDYIPSFFPVDLAFHVLPEMKQKMNGWVCSQYLRDIGTLESLDKAELEWGEIIAGSKF